MKNCKHYLLLLLAGALLVLPVTQHYAMSWDDIKTNIASFFNQDSLQKIVPGGIIALGFVGSLYYWWTKNKIGSEKKSSNETDIDPLMLEQQDKTDINPSMERGTLKQIPIYSQNSVGGEGEASSGYHVLLRAMQVVKYKGLSREDTFFFETKALEEREPTVVEVFFGKKQNTGQEEDGVWRKAIIDRRTNKSEAISDGDWLTGEEISYLWNLGKDDVRFDVLKEISCTLHVVDDNNFDRTSLFIHGKVKPLLNQKTPFFVIFMLHAKYLLHWYSLVMYQNAHGHRQYYIMDSDNNADRTHDTNALKIIDLIEQ